MAERGSHKNEENTGPGGKTTNLQDLFLATSAPRKKGKKPQGSKSRSQGEGNDGSSLPRSSIQSAAEGMQASDGLAASGTQQGNMNLNKSEEPKREPKPLPPRFHRASDVIRYRDGKPYPDLLLNAGMLPRLTRTSKGRPVTEEERKEAYKSISKGEMLDPNGRRVGLLTEMKDHMGMNSRHYKSAERTQKQAVVVDDNLLEMLKDLLGDEGEVLDNDNLASGNTGNIDHEQMNQLSGGRTQNEIMQELQKVMGNQGGGQQQQLGGQFAQALNLQAGGGDLATLQALAQLQPALGAGGNSQQNLLTALQDQLGAMPALQGAVRERQQAALGNQDLLGGPLRGLQALPGQGMGQLEDVQVNQGAGRGLASAAGLVRVDAGGTNQQQDMKQFMQRLSVALEGMDEGTKQEILQEQAQTLRMSAQLEQMARNQPDELQRALQQGGGRPGRGPVLPQEEDDVDPNQADPNEVIQQVLAMERMKARNSRSPKSQGMCTVIIIDTSASMDNGPLQEAVKFVTEFLNSLDELKIEYQLEENVAVANVGLEITVVQHLTTDTQALRRAIDSLYADGPGPLHIGMLLPLAVLGADPTNKREGIAVVHGHSIQPRVILLTDGHPSTVPDIRGMSHHSQTQGAMELKNLCAELTHRQSEQTMARVYCVPVGNADTEYLSNLAGMTGGKLLKKEDARALSRAYLHHTVAGKAKMSRRQINDKAVVVDIVKSEMTSYTDEDVEAVWDILKEGEPNFDEHDRIMVEHEQQQRQQFQQMQELQQQVGAGQAGIPGGAEGGIPGAGVGVPGQVFGAGGRGAEFGMVGPQARIGPGGMGQAGPGMSLLQGNMGQGRGGGGTNGWPGFS